jgi:formyltetrahydrofolate-dependent phosphoribosylglycinamide formyltransferase
MLKIGILGSTRGSDLQAVIDAVRQGRLKGVEISVVVSDREDAYILERARKHGIKAVFVGRKDYPDTEAFNRAISDALKGNGAELVLLIGYMRIVREPLLSAFKDRMMNIHPSLLPKYAGGMDRNVHEEVLRSSDRETGCTLHFVTADLDSGPVIMQEKVAVEPEDNPDSLKAKVQEAEKRVIIKAIELYRDGKIRVDKGKVILNEG